MQKVGRITLNLCSTSSPENMSEDEARKLLDVEMELNGPITTELYRKHKVLIRVHL